MELLSFVGGIDDREWQLIDNRDGGEPIRWKPLIVSYESRAEWLGVTSDVSWLLGVPDRFADKRRVGGIVFTGEERRFYPLLPLLDRDVADVREEADAVADERGLRRDELWELLPWRSAIEWGLRSGRDQYVNPALEWIEVLGTRNAMVTDLLPQPADDRSRRPRA